MSKCAKLKSECRQYSDSRKVGVGPSGTPGVVYLAHLLPPSPGGEVHRQLGPLNVGMLPDNFQFAPADTDMFINNALVTSRGRFLDSRRR